ncbi:uncharacterized protein SPSK_06279 [Sporothrix schenckii 1099-18]|uniref:Uncharacterized protein n=1 Tax=Sporothrix schenckii 1099-18 TaxID=1397361 RepID=A0A0F2MK66_SPOSC|nr:uncharacterized protein SPSK_06279 [Sporothrix schenckii 1099-18]KJR90002.1 hypothetical protein SPSK_06279 [Sporothrix schenckii 1099-18]
MESDSSSSMALPSAKWASFDPWNYGGMKERLEGIIAKLDAAVLVDHAQQILEQTVTLSKPFSAGQYWICFELVAEDKRLVIARVRLPRHPDTPLALSDEDEQYAIGCEVATMSHVRKHLPDVKIPTVYAYEPAGSHSASALGAPYMLIEGFYGNTLQDVEFDMCNLPASASPCFLSLSHPSLLKQFLTEHIITQWTRVQAEIATLSFSCIGSISSISKGDGEEPSLGKLAAAPLDGLDNAGPFSSTAAYFKAIADSAVKREQHESSRRPPGDRLPWFALGAYVFHDIVHNTSVYLHMDGERFPLNHMDLGTQNILVDSAFNFVAIIDWEFAQSAPWAVNHYPMPFSLLDSDAEIQAILADPAHLAYENMSRQEAARTMYVKGFRAAETALQEQGRTLAGGSFADVLDSPSSRIYACFTRLGRMASADQGLVQEMVRLAFDFDREKTKVYLHDLETKVFAEGTSIQKSS